MERGERAQSLKMAEEESCRSQTPHHRRDMNVPPNPHVSGTKNICPMDSFPPFSPAVLRVAIIATGLFFLYLFFLLLVLAIIAPPRLCRGSK